MGQKANNYKRFRRIKKWKDVSLRKKYETTVPDKYMEGWASHYKKQMETPLGKLEPHYAHYALTEFAFFTKNEERSGKKALELATGDGIDACYLAQLGYEVTALDLLPSSIEITRKRAEALDLEDRITILLEDIDTHKVIKDEYDIISAIQCLQYLYDRALPRLYELLEAVKPGGFFLYGGNVLPHFKTDPPLRFITQTELKESLKKWKIYSIANEVRLVRENDRRGYIWVVAQKPKNE